MRSNLLMNCLWYEDIAPEDMANELELTPEALFRKIFQYEEFTEVEINKIKARLGLTEEETNTIFYSWEENLMDEVYISQWDALNCFEDWEDSRGRFHWAHEDVTYQAIEKLPPADVIPVEWILKQDGGEELVKRWKEAKK